MKRKSEDPSLSEIILRGKEDAMRELFLPVSHCDAGFLFYRHTLHFRDLLFRKRKSRLLRNFAILCFFILSSAIFSIFSFSQLHAEVGVAISGTVTDTTGNCIPGVNIEITGLSVGTTTDWAGSYSLTNIQAGSYSLNVTHLGFYPVRDYNVEVKTGSVENVNFVLDSRSIELPGVEVAQRSRNNSFIQGESILISKVTWSERGSENVGDALSNVPGITLLEGDGNQRISLRGCPSRAVKVLLDGIPLNDAGTGEAILNQVDIDNLDVIEVDFSGYGGEVRLLSRKPEAHGQVEDWAEVATEYGSYGRYSGKLKLSAYKNYYYGIAHFKRFYEKGDFQYELVDGEEKKEHYRLNNSTDITSGNLKFGRDGRIASVESGIYYESNRHGIPGLIYLSPTPETSLSHERKSGVVKGKFESKWLSVDSKFYLSDYTGQYKSPGEQYNPETGDIVHHLAEENRQEGLRIGAESILYSDFSSGRLSAGYVFTKDEYIGKDLLRGSTSVGGIGFGKAERSVHNVRIGGDYRRPSSGLNFGINPNLSYSWINNSGINDYSYFEPNLSFRIQKSLQTCHLNINTGWGQSLLSPPFNALFLVESVYAVGNKELRPEKGQSTHLSINLSSLVTFPVSWNLNVNGFYRLTEDMIVWKRNSFGKYYPENVTRVKIKGLESSGGLSLMQDRVKLSASYILNDAEIDTEGDFNRGNLPPLIARHSGSAEIAIKISGTNLNIRNRYVGRRYSTASNLDPISTAGMGLPAYSIYNFFCSRVFRWQALKTTVEFGIDNLFDKSYRVIERSPMPGRAYRIQIKLGLEKQD